MSRYWYSTALEQLDKRVETLEGGGTTAPPDSALEQRVATLESSVGTLETNVTNLNSQLAALDARVRALEAVFRRR